MVPERLTAPARHLVMGDDEVAHVLIFEARLAIIFIDVSLVETRRRKHREQAVNAGLDQMNAGRFERLAQTRRKTQSATLLFPHLWSPTRLPPQYTNEPHHNPFTTTTPISSHPSTKNH